MSLMKSAKRLMTKGGGVLPSPLRSAGEDIGVFNSKGKNNVAPPPSAAPVTPEVAQPDETEMEDQLEGFGRYERLGDQFKNSRDAVKMLPKQFRSRLGASTEDLGSKILTVTKAVEAGAAVLQNPQTPAPAKPAASVSVDIPYVPIGLAVLAVIGIFMLMRKK